jgi:peroxiredoxin
MELKSPQTRAHLAALAHTIALLLAVIAGMLAYPLLSHAAPVPAGATAPDFALKDTSGRNQRLSEHRGDVVVLTFWASWCGPCRESVAGIERAVAGLADPSAVALTVSLDGDAGRVASMAQSLGLERPPLLDERQSVGRLYDVGQLPLTLLIDREGTVRRVWSRDPAPRDSLVQSIMEFTQ